SYIKLLNANISGRKMQESSLNIESQKQVVKIQGSLFGNYISFDTRLDFSQQSQDLIHKSFVNVNLNVKDISYLFGSFLAHNLTKGSLKGEVKGKLNSNFNLQALERLNLELLIDSFSYSRAPVDIMLMES